LTAAGRKAPPKLDRLYNTSTQNYKTDLQDNHKQQVLDRMFASQQILWPDFTAEEPIVPTTEYVEAQADLMKPRKRRSEKPCGRYT